MALGGASLARRNFSTGAQNKHYYGIAMEKPYSGPWNSVFHIKASRHCMLQLCMDHWQDGPAFRMNIHC